MAVHNVQVFPVEYVGFKQKVLLPSADRCMSALLNLLLLYHERGASYHKWGYFSANSLSKRTDGALIPELWKSKLCQPPHESSALMTFSVWTSAKE